VIGVDYYAIGLKSNGEYLTFEGKDVPQVKTNTMVAKLGKITLLWLVRNII